MGVDIINPLVEGKREVFLRGSGNAGDRATFQITNSGIKVLNSGYLLIGTRAYKYNVSTPVLDTIDGTTTGLNLLTIPQGQRQFLDSPTEVVATSGQFTTSVPGWAGANTFSFNAAFNFGDYTYTANGLGRGQIGGYLLSPDPGGTTIWRWLPSSDGKIGGSTASKDSLDTSAYWGVFGNVTGTWANAGSPAVWSYANNIGSGSLAIQSRTTYTTFTSSFFLDGIPSFMNSNNDSYMVGSQGSLFYAAMTNTNKILRQFGNSSIFGSNATLGAIGYGRIANSPAPNASIYLIAENSPTRRFWYATNPSGTWQQYSGAVHPNNNGYLSKIRFIGTRAFVFDSNFGTVYSSNDLTTWTAVASTVSSGSRYFGFIGSFLVLLSEGNSESTSAPFMQYSTDGVTWTPVYNLSSGAPGQAYHYSLIYEPTSQYWWSFMGDTYRHAFASGTGTTTASIHIPTRFKIGTPSAVIEIYANSV